MADSIVKLRVESSEYDAKLKRATQGLLHMEESCRKVGGTLAVLEKDEREFVRSLGNMETVSKDARGRVNELTKAFTELSVQYNRLSDEEKKGHFGQDLRYSLDQLAERTRNAKAELKSINTELGGSQGFRGMLESVSGKLGINTELLSSVTSGTIAYTAAAGAAATAVYKAAEAWTKYNEEIAKQDQVTMVTTGLNGTDATAMTDQVRAMADTYNVDFREAINAANTLMTQFGENGQNALDLLKDGMQGMIAGDGTKLLQMIQQYAPAFRDAGVEASQLIAIIHNTEGGIFTDQNMNAIVMGIKNIRMMKDTTKEAMRSIGIDADYIAKKLNDGSMSVFEALKLISGKIDEVGSGSQAAGEIMNDIFGKQGVAAGTNLGKAIEELNLNLDETKLQTGNVGEAMTELQQANEQLNAQIRATFGYKGWEEMETGLKVKLVNAVTNVMRAIEKVEDAFKACKNVYDNIERALDSSFIGKVIRGWYDALLNAVSPFKTIYEYVYKILGALGKAPNVKVPKVDTPGTKTNAPITTTTGGNKHGGKGGKGDPGSRRGESEEERREKSINNLVGKSQRQFKSAVLDEDKMLKALNLDKPLGVATALGLAGKDVDINALNAMGGLKPNGDKTYAWYQWEEKGDAKKARNKKDGDDKDKKKNDDTVVKEIGKMTEGIGSVVGGLEQLGIDIPDGLNKTLGVMQALLSIVSGISTVVIAIAAMSSIPFLHTGGLVHAAKGVFVPGAANGGRDTVPAMLSPGELVLNQAQQSSLAAQLQQNNIGTNLHLSATLRGEDINLAVNNNNRRRGRGEYVTTR